MLPRFRKKAIHEVVRIRSLISTDTPAVSTETDVCLIKEKDVEWSNGDYCYISIVYNSRHMNSGF